EICRDAEELVLVTSGFSLGLRQGIRRCLGLGALPRRRRSTAFGALSTVVGGLFGGGGRGLGLRLRRFRGRLGLFSHGGGSIITHECLPTGGASRTSPRERSTLAPEPASFRFRRRRGRVPSMHPRRRESFLVSRRGRPGRPCLTTALTKCN